MTIFTRYIVLELMKVFFIALSALTLLMIVGAVVQEAYKEGLGLRQIVQVIPYILPDALRFTIPATALFATCSVYGRMAAASEIVAVKSLGISPVAVVMPAYVLAALLSLATVVVNDIAVSWGRNGVRRVVIEAVDEIAYGILRVQRSYSARGIAINVRRVEGRRLIQPMFTFQGNAGRTVTVRCQEAELRCDTARDVLLITCRDGTVDVDGEVTIRFPGVDVREIPLQDASGQRKDSELSPSWMSLADIRRQTGEQAAKLVTLREEIAIKASFQMLSGDFHELAGQEWKVLNAAYNDARNHHFRLQTEPHRRWSNGFSCLCFVLMGAPMAIRLRNSDFLTSFFLCFLPILIIYYPLLMLGVDRAKSGSLPVYSVWLGNVVLLAWGCWLMRKVVRY